MCLPVHLYKNLQHTKNPQKLCCQKFLYSIQNSMDRNENHHKCFTNYTYFPDSSSFFSHPLANGELAACSMYSA